MSFQDPFQMLQDRYGGSAKSMRFRWLNNYLSESTRPLEDGRKENSFDANRHPL